MKLRKRFLSVVLTIAMLGSSLQFPERTLQAQELSKETAVESGETEELASETQESSLAEKTAPLREIIKIEEEGKKPYI